MNSMNTAGTQNAYDQEIDLRDLIFAVLHKWKLVMGVAVLFAVLLGGAKGALTYKHQNDPEAISKREDDYHNALEQYENDMATYEREIKNITDDIANQQDYLENSILMNMSPYDVCEARADLFIKTDYEIMPGMLYQNVDYTDTILQAYQSVMTSTAFLENITRSSGLKTRYLQELITVERGNTTIVDSNVSQLTNLLTIKVKHTNRKKAEGILGNILDQVDVLQRQITRSIGKHTVNALNNSSGSTIDLELATRQDEESKRLETLKKTLLEKETALNELEEPAAAGSSKLVAAKSAIKYGVLGGVLGGFMIVFFVCVIFLMSDKLYSSKELRQRFRIKVLGTLPAVAGQKINPIDSWINRLEGQALGKDPDMEYNLIAANIRNHSSHIKMILVDGCADLEHVTEIAEQLKKQLPNIRIIAGGNMLHNADTILKLSECDGVVLVEQCKISTYQNIELEIEKICELKKEVIGAVVFE